MANYKHVELLKEGVQVWNDWRSADPDIKPNLSGANLVQTVLVESNLRQADLRKTDLRKTNLSHSDLYKVDLRNANLRGAQLVKTDLRGANLSGAILIDADLRKADLHGADLRRTNLTNADLHDADLGETNLGEANLTRASLISATLERSNLRGANLVDASLIIANLTGTDFSLATLTGTKLYGTERDDWRIDGAKCDYAFWDPTGNTRTPAERNYRPGEFELLYRQLPTIEYVFEDGFTPLSALLMDRIVKVINDRNPELELHLDSLILRGIPRAVFSVLHREQCARTLDLVTDLYKTQSEQIRDKQSTLKSCYQQITGRLQ